MHQTILSLLLAALIATLSAFPPSAAVAATPSLQQQRQAFLEARRAIHRGRMKRFHELAGGLKGYLLYPYLRYEELRRGLRTADTKEIAAFLKEHDGEAVAILLRRHWLNQLAKSKRWKAYLAFYRPDYSTIRHCYYLHARLRTGHTDGLWKEVEETWTVGKSQPNACDPVFDAWRAAGGMTREQVLKRIDLAMAHRRLSLVTYLAKLLPKKEAAWVHRWQRLHRNPDKELDKLTAGADPEWRARLFAYGVKRLAIRDEEKALEVWRKRAGEFVLSDELKAATERSLGLRLAYRHHPQADEVLAGLPAADDETRQWRIANHIWHHEWPELLGALDALPKEEAKDDRWRYWRARAMEGIGNHAEAQRLYAAAAAGNGYYSFLAAEHAGQSPRVHNEPLPVQPRVLDQLAKQPALQRAHELFRLNLSSDADREWYYFTKDLDVETKRAAAKLAERWGWHHRAILTVARTGHLDDLELRFPTPYREPILNSAKQAKLDPAMVYALIRQESAFKRDARSPVGALGLMQLMPATAKRTGRLIKRPVRSNWEILDASTNIRLGTSHLNHLMHEYNDNRIFTAVAYNAGPHRVRKWLPDEPQPADAWIEGVPFDETRGYIKRILSYTLIYEWRLGRPLTPLSKHMPEIKPRS